MPHIPLKEWAKQRKISRRKAEYIAAARPDLVVLLPQQICRTIHAKCIDEDLDPAHILLR